MRSTSRWTTLVLVLVLAVTGLAACGASSVESSGDGGGGDGDGGGGDVDAGRPDATAAPTCTDRVQNGAETGVDCGGPDCVACDVVELADYYVSPDGRDDGPGTIEDPFATWDKLRDVLQPGDLAYIRGGTYTSTRGGDAEVHVNWRDFAGTAEAPIRIWAYPGERPVLDLSNVTTTVNANAVQMQNVSYLWIKGLRVTGLAQQPGTFVAAWFLGYASNCIIEFVEVDHVDGYGFILGNDSTDNLFQNCDAHHLADALTGNEGANGFMQTGNVGARRNTFSGCRAWWVADDGFDLFGDDGEATIEHSWSFWNGFVPGTMEPAEGGDGQGFKLGPNATAMPTTPLRIVRGNVAAANKVFGFDQNGANSGYVFYNNTAYGNQRGFEWGYFPELVTTFRNNLAYDNGEDVHGDRSNWIDDHNSWNGGVTVTDDDFLGLDVALLAAPRQASGALPDVPTLRLAPGSDLVGAGVDVGLPFQGGAPDLGAFER